MVRRGASYPIAMNRSAINLPKRSPRRLFSVSRMRVGIFLITEPRRAPTCRYAILAAANRRCLLCDFMQVALQPFGVFLGRLRGPSAKPVEPPPTSRRRPSRFIPVLLDRGEPFDGADVTPCVATPIHPVPVVFCSTSVH